MNLSESEIERLLAEGGIVSGDDGEQIEIERDAPAESPNKALLGLIREQMALIRDLQAKVGQRSEPPPPPAPLPIREVSPPSQRKPAVWNFEVQERDKEGRVVRARFQEWLQP